MPESLDVMINSQSYRVVTDAFIPGGINTGVYYAIPPVGFPPRVGAEERDMRIIDFPGVDGCWTKTFGFRGRSIEIQLIVIGSNKQDCADKRNTMLAYVNVINRFTIFFPGVGTYMGCKLITGGAQISENFTWHNRVCEKVNLQFRQYSETNG
jgi:hypothetical protein